MRQICTVVWNDGPIRSNYCPVVGPRAVLSSDNGTMHDGPIIIPSSVLSSRRILVWPVWSLCITACNMKATFTVVPVPEIIHHAVLNLTCAQFLYFTLSKLLSLGIVLCPNSTSSSSLLPLLVETQLLLALPCWYIAYVAPRPRSVLVTLYTSNPWWSELVTLQTRVTSNLLTLLDGWQEWHLACEKYFTGWPLFWKTWKSWGIEKCSGKSQGKWIITIIQLPRLLFRQKYATVFLLYFSGQSIPHIQ